MLVPILRPKQSLPIEAWTPLYPWRCIEENRIFHCFVVQFWYSHTHCWCCWQWVEVSIGALTCQQLYSSICNKLQYTVFWHLSVRTSINFFSNLTNSSLAVRLDHTDKPLITTWISAPLPPMAVGTLPLCSSPLFFLWTTYDRYDPLSTGNPHKSCGFGNLLTQSSMHHNLPWEIVLKSLRLPIFLVSNT